MSAAEGVVHVLKGRVDFFYFSRREGFGLLKAVAEFAAEGFAANELLISGHGECGRADVGAAAAVFGVRGVKFAVGIIVGIHIDQLHVEIGVGFSGRNEKKGGGG